MSAAPGRSRLAAADLAEHAAAGIFARPLRSLLKRCRSACCSLMSFVFSSRCTCNPANRASMVERVSSISAACRLRCSAICAR